MIASAGKRRPHRRYGIGSLGAVRPAGLGKIGPATAALPADRRRRQPHQVDRRTSGRQIIGHTDRNRCPAVIDRNQHRDTRAQLCLGLIDQPTQALGFQPLDDLADEARAYMQAALARK